eukprot:12599693-Alexandrium_andersonii.AAC.1
MGPELPSSKAQPRVPLSGASAALTTPNNPQGSHPRSSRSISVVLFEAPASGFLQASRSRQLRPRVFAAGSNG